MKFMLGHENRGNIVLKNSTGIITLLIFKKFKRQNYSHSFGGDNKERIKKSKVGSELLNLLN